MRIIKSLIAFFVLFCLLAVTVVCSAFSTGKALEEKTEQAKTQPTQSTEYVQAVSYNIKDNKEKEQVKDYTPRLNAPSEQNEYYFSNINDFYRDGWGMPNCTAYAFGRAYELLKQKPKLSLSDACDWYEYNLENRFYKYGKKPKLGAVACWGYKDGGSGHVAVVEKIEDNTVYCSNSAWGGASFYVDSFPINNPERASENLIFHGYIYILDI